MVDDSALGIQSAHSGARIDAAVVDARLVARAFRVLDAFRTTSAVRIAQVVGRTRTDGVAALLFALSSGSARWWIARIERSGGRWFLLDGNWLETADERISGHSVRTRADRVVIANDANSSDSAHSGTRISAFLVDAV